jgi:hypothetical protein
VRIRVSMPAIIDRAGRNFNVDEADGVSRRDNHHPRPARTPKAHGVRPSARRQSTAKHDPTKPPAGRQMGGLFPTHYVGVDLTPGVDDGAARRAR